MGELGALFNPGMRHELEERQAKAARREEEGNARDGDLRIDLESGVAVINVPGNDDDADRSAAAPDARPEQDTESRSAADEAGADPAAEVAKPDPAVLRPRGKRGMSTAGR